MTGDDSGPAPPPHPAPPPPGPGVQRTGGVRNGGQPPLRQDQVRHQVSPERCPQNRLIALELVVASGFTIFGVHFTLTVTTSKHKVFWYKTDSIQYREDL